VVTVAYEQVVRLVEALVGASRRVRLVMDFMNMQDFGGDLANVGGWLDGVHVASFGLRPDDTRLIRQIESWQRGARDRVAVVTLGASGSLVLAGDASTPIPAVPVAKVVDTTGAGDAYLAAFLSRYLNGETPADAARFAARHASGVVQTLGAF
jgi:sugar/nucleoside kinase (ribokinase family)